MRPIVRCMHTYTAHLALDLSFGLRFSLSSARGFGGHRCQGIKTSDPARSGTSPLNCCCSTGSRTMQEIVSMSERA